MKKSLHIKTSFEKPGLMKNLVEMLAIKRNDEYFDNQMLPMGWEALKSSSIEAFVSGSMELEDEKEFLNIPFISSFLFICLRGKKDPYRISGSMSLS